MPMRIGILSILLVALVASGTFYWQYLKNPSIAEDIVKSGQSIEQALNTFIEKEIIQSLR